MRAGYRPHVLGILIPVALIITALTAGALAADRVVLGEVFAASG